MSEAFDKIEAGLKDAIAYQQGCTSRGRIHRIVQNGINRWMSGALKLVTIADHAGRTEPMPMNITIQLCQISNGWLVSTPGTYAQGDDETSLFEDRQPAVTFYPDFASVLTGLPEEAQKAFKHEQDTDTARRNYASRYKGEPIGAAAPPPVNGDGIPHEAPAMGREAVGEPVDQTEQMESVPEEELTDAERKQLKREK